MDRSTSGGRVVIDYGQFYVYGSEGARASEPRLPGREDLATGVWTGEASLTVFAPRPHGPTDVTIEAFDEPPEVELNAWDNVVETSLPVPSGTVVADSWDAAEGRRVELPVEPGAYRVRILGRGFDEAQDSETGDFYLIQVWPGSAAPADVLKVWGGFRRLFGGG